MAELLFIGRSCAASARRWQHINYRSVELFFLQSVFAPGPGEFLVGNFAVERDHAWSDSLELSMKGFPASSELPSGHIGATFRWALHYVRQPYPELGYAHTIERLQAFRHESAFVEQ